MDEELTPPRLLPTAWPIAIIWFAVFTVFPAIGSALYDHSILTGLIALLTLGMISLCTLPIPVLIVYGIRYFTFIGRRGTRQIKAAAQAQAPGQPLQGPPPPRFEDPFNYPQH